MTTDTFENAEMAYIGLATCGCVVAATVDDPKHARDVARFVAQGIRSGLTIQRMSVEEVRALKFGCPHQAKRRIKEQKS